MSSDRVARFNTKKTRIFRIEKISDLVLDVFYDQAVYAPAKVRALLEEFGLVTVLATGIVRIDLAPSQDADLIVTYLGDYSILDAKQQRLHWGKETP